MNTNKPIKYNNATAIFYDNDTKFVKISACVNDEKDEKIISSFTLASVFDKKGQLGLDAEIIKMIRFEGSIVPANDGTADSSIMKYVDTLNEPEAERLIRKHCLQMTRLFNHLTDEAINELIFLNSCSVEAEKYRRIRAKRIDALCVEIAKLVESLTREREKEL